MGYYDKRRIVAREKTRRQTVVRRFSRRRTRLRRSHHCCRSNTMVKSHGDDPVDGRTWLSSLWTHYELDPTRTNGDDRYHKTGEGETARLTESRGMMGREMAKSRRLEKIGSCLG